MVDNLSFRNFLQEQVPKSFVNHLITGIAKIYQDSYDLIFDKYPREQAMDLLPLYRRTEIEAYLRLLPNLFPEVMISCETNIAQNSFHVEVEINNIVFTQSFSPNPNETVREAKFRNSLSEFNLQLHFDFLKENVVKEQHKKIFAILQHGAEGREIKKPEFFNLIFPSENRDNIVTPIDLIKLYNISPDILGSDVETIELEAALNNPQLKVPAKTANNSEVI